MAYSRAFRDDSLSAPALKDLFLSIPATLQNTQRRPSCWEKGSERTALKDRLAFPNFRNGKGFIAEFDKSLLRRAGRKENLLTELCGTAFAVSFFSFFKHLIINQRGGKSCEKILRFGDRSIFGNRLYLVGRGGN